MRRRAGGSKNGLTWRRKQAVATMVKIIGIIRESMRGLRQGLPDILERRPDLDADRKRRFRLAEPTGIVAEHGILL